jgi:hypothetical protein
MEQHPWQIAAPDTPRGTKQQAVNAVTARVGGPVVIILGIVSIVVGVRS